MTGKVTSATWPDEPASSIAEDRFGRGTFAKMITTRIDGAPVGLPSTVFGLVGPWGGGKTSLLNMVRDELKGADWSVVDFSPWAAADASSLTSEFLSTLASAFGDEGEGGRLRETIFSYSRVAIPFLGLLGPLGTVAQSAASAGIDLVNSQRPPWHVAFKDLADKIAARGRRVLIIADDIDRLEPTELVALLRVIRLLGRFENVHYLLAYDQDTIESVLTSQGLTGRTTSFMEKIVQYPFEVPPMASIDKRRLLNQTVRSLIDRADESSIRISADQLDIREQRALSLISILLDGLATPRSFTRFQEQLNSYATLVSFDEVDVLDFVAVTYLRVFHHALWATLPRWRGELTTRKPSATTPDGGVDPLTEQMRRLADERNYRPALSMIGFLTEDVSTGTHGGAESFSPRFANADYFERYFITHLADDDVSDALVAEALRELVIGRAASSRAEVLATLIDDIENPGRGMLALEKILNRRILEDGGSEAAITYVLARIQAQPSGDASFDRPRGLLRRWAAIEMLAGLEDEFLTAESAINMFGEDLAFGNLYQLNGSLATRKKVKRQAPKFVDFIVDQLTGSIDDVLQTRSRLRAYFDLAVFAGAEDRVAGILDDQVEGNLATFADSVASFGTVNQWVGSGYHYEITFSENLYYLAFSERIRAELAPQLNPSRSRGDFAFDELPTYPPEEDIRDFALDCAKGLAARDRDERSSEREV